MKYTYEDIYKEKQEKHEAIANLIMLIFRIPLVAVLSHYAITSWLVLLDKPNYFPWLICCFLFLIPRAGTSCMIAIALSLIYPYFM